MNCRIEFKLSFINTSNDNDIFIFYDAEQLQEFRANPNSVKYFDGFYINGKEVLTCDKYKESQDEMTYTAIAIVAALEK